MNKETSEDNLLNRGICLNPDLDLRQRGIITPQGNPCS
jgi:hypothetical protein